MGYHVNHTSLSQAISVLQLKHGQYRCENVIKMNTRSLLTITHGPNDR